MPEAKQAESQQDMHPNIRAVIEVLESRSYSYYEDSSNENYVVIYAVSNGSKIRIGVKAEIIAHFTEAELRDALPHFLR